MISVFRLGFERRKEDGSPEKEKLSLVGMVLVKMLRVNDFIYLNLF